MTIQRDIIVTVSVCESVAVVATVFRLVLRTRARRLSWDDAFAFLSLLISFVFFATFISVGVGAVLPKQPKLAMYWLGTLMFGCTTWTARLSILASILRFAPLNPIRHLRTLIISTGILFFFLWMASIIAITVRCTSLTSWEKLVIPHCPLGNKVAIVMLVTDFVGDAILIAIPLRLLWRVPLPAGERRLVLTLFCASVLTTMAVIVHTYFTLKPLGVWQGITAFIEAAVSLFVCNFVVIVAFFYRLFDRGDEPASAALSKVLFTTVYPDNRTSKAETQSTTSSLEKA